MTADPTREAVTAWLRNKAEEEEGWAADPRPPFDSAEEHRQKAALYRAALRDVEAMQALRESRPRLCISWRGSENGTVWGVRRASVRSFVRPEDVTERDDPADAILAASLPPESK